MDRAAEIRGALEAAGWTAQQAARLCAAILEGAGGYACFDADNTLWEGDLGESVFVWMGRNLKLAPGLGALLPRSLDVPASAKTSAGRLFPAARLARAEQTLLERWRARVSPDAGWSELAEAFDEAMVAPGGILADDADFCAAWTQYQGVLYACYGLLDQTVGRVVWRDGAPAAEVPFEEAVRAFYADQAHDGGPLARFTRVGPDGRAEILFPGLEDSGPDQDRLRRWGRLGSYSQVATWVSWHQRPERLREIAHLVWDSSPGVDVPRQAAFPVDGPDAREPAQNVELRAVYMPQGTRIRPRMVALLAALQQNNVLPFVISASQHDLVAAVLERELGVPERRMHGMKLGLEGEVYGERLLEPVTYRGGKVHAARLLVGMEAPPPVLCAGDSTTDLELIAWSGRCRLIFDRGDPLLVGLARWLEARGAADRTVVAGA